MLTGPTLLPQSGEKAKKLIVFLHGYGSEGSDLISLAHPWASLMPGTEFFAPNGLFPCESYSFGFQWFSLKEFTPFYVGRGLTEVRPLMRNYLLQMVSQRNLTLGDLAIVGFSQGGMLALDLAFALPGLRGSICYSGGFYPPDEFLLPSPSPEILLVHGDADTCVPYASFLDAQHQLEKRGIHPHTLTCTGLGHTIDKEGIKKGGEFLATLLAT